jgi:quercetin dioxygenase-like cupin family protein
MCNPPRVVWMPGAVRTEIHLDSADTGGAFCLLVDEPPPGWSLPAHLHRAQAETIHVIDGALEMTVDGRRSLLAQGESIHVPAGAVHTSANPGAAPLRRVVIFSPGGMERFFIEAGVATPDTEPARAAALAAAIRHGWEFVETGER